MTERTELLLAELLEVQRQVLANQNRALEQQQVALVRQHRGIRIVLLLVVLITLSVLLPYAWEWLVFLRGQ